MCIVLILTLNFEGGEMLTMQLPEKNERKLVIKLAVAKLKVKSKHPLFVLTLNRSFFVLKRDLYSNKIFNFLPFPDKAEARFRVKTKLQ